MTGRTLSPTGAARAALRLAVLATAAIGLWVLADTLSTEPAHADNRRPVLDATLDDLTGLDGLLPDHVVDEVEETVADVEQIIESVTQISVTPAPHDDNLGHEGPIEPPADDVIPTPRPAPTLTPAKHSPAARPTAKPRRAPTSDAPKRRTTIAADITDRETGPPPAREANPPLRGPVCNPDAAAGGGVAAVSTPPAGIDADLAAGWWPPNLPSAVTRDCDTRASGLSQRPGAPPG